mmetsp:Transcript_149837/g.481339  ORF Transcript_149837/g.481339 Transcript_149837/m.481339 type:complete len:211 (+) Transcript_149837:301-933(+)
MRCSVPHSTSCGRCWPRGRSPCWSSTAGRCQPRGWSRSLGGMLATSPGGAPLLTSTAQASQPRPAWRRDERQRGSWLGASTLRQRLPQRAFGRLTPWASSASSRLARPMPNWHTSRTRVESTFARPRTPICWPTVAHGWSLASTAPDTAARSVWRTCRGPAASPPTGPRPRACPTSVCSQAATTWHQFPVSACAQPRSYCTAAGAIWAER